ncbi:MAG: Tyrosine-tRNA ligase, cytoplasmic [Candidatus Daviesbacteria bacterium GW2011_GWA1_38_7]|nr:MAG: Tyrosine-tRNA ligase, cytoplasmic [Candidatus Daviesbacteria bacterium GW2011_GWA1_38_7]MBS3155130.1 tyrosine--tRNA ligase [Candidatus Woesearchaeota archaeon]
MDRFELIKRNTTEIIEENELRELLKNKKNPVIYWGTAPTSSPHVGYFLPMLKIADFLKAGFKVKILLADLHAALDNTPWSVLEKRYKYYEKVIPLIIQSIGVDVKNLELIKGSDFQLEPEYMFDVLQMSSYVSVRDANKAASEVVKMGDNPKLSGLIYPIMQALDEQYLEVDAQLGGTDQRKIMVLARENLPKLGYKSRIEIMNPLVPGLIGKKMSSSDEKSKIDLLDSEEAVIKKLNDAECISGDPDNGIMAFLKYVIMVIKQDKNQKFVIKRDKKYGGNLEFSNYEQIGEKFVKKELHPQDLKKAVAEEINSLLSLFRKNKIILEKLAKDAYSK